MTSNILDHNDEIISVGELNRSAKYLLEKNFNNVSVIGEISNLSRPSSGHIYFTLKDEDGAIRCAIRGAIRGATRGAIKGAIENSVRESIRSI